MIKIAILNLSDIDELKYTINCLEKIHEEIIGVQIDMFIDKKNLHYIHDNKYIRDIIPLNLNNINIFNFKNKYDSLDYYNKNKYHIAVDTEGTFKSAFFNYQLTGKTAGFLQNGFLNKLISYFYDERIELKSILEKEEKTKLLLSQTFGFEL